LPSGNKAIKGAREKRKAAAGKHVRQSLKNRPTLCYHRRAPQPSQAASGTDMAKSNGIDLDSANRIIETGIRLAREHNHLPLTLCILDRGGHLVSFQREDNSSILRFEIAFGKAWGSLGLAHSTRFMEKVMANNRPHFLDSLAAASGGRFVPALGGILIRDAEGRIQGALGLTGDTGENDEMVGVEAINACGFRADLG
jgi:uncharacterized protein GlcG (DUF336 family)